MKTHLIYLSIICFISLVSSEKIIVHVLPHSHDDPGWIKTVKEYFEGSIIPILDNTIQSLLENPKRTFIYSEMAFFKPWYEMQKEETKNALKQLIKEGRFEFVNGGWVMEDEAASNYNDAITQLRSGLEFLKDEFNVTPHIGWFLDQFGHSQSHGYLYTQFGYDKLVLGRSHVNLKAELYKKGDLELFWKPFGQNEIFTHLIYDYYCPPKSIRNFVNEKKLTFGESQLKNYAEGFLSNIRREMKGYKHNHYMLFYGCDFTFTAKDANFFNIESLMNYMNDKYKDDIEIKYSTAETYFQEVEAALKEQSDSMKRFDTDFLPYVDGGIWTGYFTSRPFMKGMIRESSSFFSASSKFYTEYALNKKVDTPHEYFNIQEQLEHAIAVTQHHDAVTGTAKTYVNDDYIKMIQEGENNVISNMKNNIKELFNDEDITICLSNGKVSLGCRVDLIEGKPITYGMFNPGIDDTVLITLETAYTNNNKTFSMVDGFGKIIEHDMYCIPDYKCYIYFFYKVEKFYSFLAFTIFAIKSAVVPEIPIQDITFNDNAKYDSTNNTVILKVAGKEYNVSLSHSFFTGTRDGAYLFNAVSPTPTRYTLKKESSFVYKGKISGAVLLRFENSYLLSVIFNSPMFIATVSAIDKVQVPYSRSINVILQLDSNVFTDKNFYTDSAGMKMIKRKVPNGVQTGEAFYPVGYAMSLNDMSQNRMVTLFNDRPEGGTCLCDGSMYLMLNRWSTSDDNKGVDEKLFEPQSSGTVFEAKNIIMVKSDNDSVNGKIKNIVDNYFTNNLLLFQGAQDMKKYMIYSKINDIFVFPSNIRMEILYVSTRRALVQFYNQYDEYFGNTENKNDMFYRKMLSIIQSKKFTIKLCDMNGFNCVLYMDKFPKRNKSNLRNSFYNQFVHFEIEPLEFRVFEIIFN